MCPKCRVLPVRVGDSFVVDANNWARGALFAVRSGASVLASATGSFNNTPAARYAVDYAYDHGVPIIASAADEFSYHHNYPSVYNHALYVNAIRFNHTDDYRKASTFWGVNPCTNFGARVWITVPAESCSSGATSRLSGVAGLVQSAARDAGRGPLHTEEIYQLLRATADDLDNSDPDWGRARYPARRGFDQLYGYGRLNAHRAVEAVLEGDIPPIADLHSPEWFTIVSPRNRPLVTVRGAVGAPRTRHATYRLDYAVGIEPTEDAYVSVSRGRLEGERTGVLGVLNLARLPLPQGPAPTNREERDRFSVSLRLTVTDDQGRKAESRRSFFVFDDPSWKPHFPVALGASGEAGPTLADLDGDGTDEIILPLADGRVRLLDWHPVGIRSHDLLLDPGPPLAPPGVIPRRVSRGLGRESAVRGVVVGDIHGRGESSIVVASYEGKVYAFSPRGERRPSFPVSLDRERGRGATKSQPIESGILSRPVLAELDGRPGAEIVVSSLDGHVYVWRGDGSLLDGFPVRVENPRTSPTRLTKLVSTPAVGDVDGDGVPDIVVGSNGTRDDLSAAYAIRARGNLHPDGALLPGWPVELSALRAELLPTLANGVQMGPLLVDVDGDGDSEVVLYAVTSNAVVLVDHKDDGPVIVARLETAPSQASEFRGTTFIAGTGSALLIDTDLDGATEVYAPLLPFRMVTLRTKPGIPLEAPLALGGWELGVSTAGQTSVPMISGYPRRMEDLMLFAQPSAEDVDGDGVAEVLMGSGGYLLHAFRRGGHESEGFPSSPAVGSFRLRRPGISMGMDHVSSWP